MRHIINAGHGERSRFELHPLLVIHKYIFNGAIIKMFNLKAKFMLFAAVLFIGGVSAASAQISNGSTIKVNVPSDFVLKGATFSAGNYVIERTPNTADAPSFLIIRGENEAMVFDTMIANSKEAADDTQLVFDTVDGVNYLSAIVVKGQTARNEIAKSKAQKSGEGVAGRYVVTISNTGF